MPRISEKLVVRNNPYQMKNTRAVKQHFPQKYSPVVHGDGAGFKNADIKLFSVQISNYLTWLIVKCFRPPPRVVTGEFAVEFATVKHDNPHPPANVMLARASHEPAYASS